MNAIPVLSQRLQSTPIYELQDTFCENHFFMKREDCIPFSFGGNKARKARFFYQDIMKKQPDTIVTYGSGSSNHCRIIANMASAMGLACHIISPSDHYEATMNSKMTELFGATIETCPVEQVSHTIDAYLEQLINIGQKPYFIQGGGHGNLGTAAYVEAYQEILEYEQQSGIQFDSIFFASGTGTTQAGLVCGQLLARRNDDQKIIGISIARTAERGYEVIADSIRGYFEEYESNLSIDYESRLIFEDAYRKGGYGKFDEEVTKTIDSVLCKEGIPMDTTYVGKAYSGMKAYIQDHAIHGQNILFIHTGGTPLFFDAIGK
ncbi:MAG: pyridoxal-phosphate dependent enzyme [bacterium]|nr:pyridoxal-phosphate dependent enzyme [bacterium]